MTFQTQEIQFLTQLSHVAGYFQFAKDRDDFRVIKEPIPIARLILEAGLGKITGVLDIDAGEGKKIFGMTGKA